MLRYGVGSLIDVAGLVQDLGYLFAFNLAERPWLRDNARLVRRVAWLEDELGTARRGMLRLIPIVA